MKKPIGQINYEAAMKFRGGIFPAWDDPETSQVIRDECTMAALAVKNTYNRVIDCLPPHDMGCIVVLGNIMVTAAYFYALDQSFRQFTRAGNLVLDDVTHWQEMPGEPYVS